MNKVPPAKGAIGKIPVAIQAHVNIIIRLGWNTTMRKFRSISKKNATNIVENGTDTYEILNESLKGSIFLLM